MAARRHQCMDRVDAVVYPSPGRRSPPHHPVGRHPRRHPPLRGAVQSAVVARATTPGTARAGENCRLGVATGILADTPCRATPERSTLFIGNLPHAKHSRPPDQPDAAPDHETTLAPWSRHSSTAPARRESRRTYRPPEVFDFRRGSDVRRRSCYLGGRAGVGREERYPVVPAWRRVVHPPARRLPQVRRRPLGGDRHAGAAGGLPARTGASIPGIGRRLFRRLPGFAAAERPGLADRDCR